MNTLQSWRRSQRHTQALSGPAGHRNEKDLLDGTRLCHGSASTSCQLCLCRDMLKGGVEEGRCWVLTRGQSPHKRALKKKKHVNLLDKTEGWAEKKEGARLKVETIAFIFCAGVFVHVCVRRGDGGGAVYWVNDMDRLNDINQISWTQICFLLWFNFWMICICPSATARLVCEREGKKKEGD